MPVVGAFVHTQRKLADVSRRELAQPTDVSKPYLSELECGLLQPP